MEIKFYKKELFKISTVKKAFVHLRTWTKVVILITIAACLIIGAIAYIYKPIYSVTLNGEFIGYSQNKSKLQQRINEYIEKGDGDHIAFVEIEELPEYKLCLLQKDIETNDEEIFNKVIEKGQNYYKFYAIAVSNEEKKYVGTEEEAEEVIAQLKNKNSNNASKLSVVEKYETELEELSDIDTCVSDLYVKKVVQSSYVVAATGVNSTSEKVPLGISLIRPVSGVVTSRFGPRWGTSHKGLDIGAPQGTPIYAAAGGTVTVAQYGYNGGYGNYVMISHGNGVQTLYGHCTTLCVEVGEQVSQGEQIATVGTTGNSTGNHLHLEIRVNGVVQDPQNYLY